MASSLTSAVGSVGRRGTRDQSEGPACSQALLRTFGSSSQPRVVLYRDTHGWCPYCHKVWLQLEHKRIPYQVIKVNMNCYGAKSPAFLKLTPRGLLPAIKIDGQFSTESSAIMQRIEDTFPERPMVPPTSQGKRINDQYMQLERALFGVWLNWLRADPSQQGEFEEIMHMVDGALDSSAGPFFGGRQIGLADCVFASSLERIAASVLYYKGLKVKHGQWPAVNEWFEAMEQDEAYRGTMSDFHTHVHDLPPQIGGCLSADTVEQRLAAAAIDGKDEASWHLPLPVLSIDSLEPGTEDSNVDKAEAASSMIHCHQGCVRSSMAGTKAPPEATDDVEEAFRLVTHALLSGTDQVLGSLEDVNASSRSAAGSCLRYTRDRICVPRDMSYPAARQLRAHINWVADLLDPRSDGQWRGIPLATRKRADMDPAVFHGASAL